MIKLSKSEKIVYEHLLKGWSNNQIADELFVSEITVKFHLTRIYKKLGVKSRKEAIAQHLG